MEFDDSFVFSGTCVLADKSIAMNQFVVLFFITTRKSVETLSKSITSDLLPFFFLTKYSYYTIQLNGQKH